MIQGSTESRPPLYFFFAGLAALRFSSIAACAAARRATGTRNGEQLTYETTPKPPYQRLLDSPDIPEATKLTLRDQHAKLDPFALKKNIELKLQKFFTALGNLKREAPKLTGLQPPVTFSRASIRNVPALPPAASLAGGQTAAGA